jgi:hypothetical protein
MLLAVFGSSVMAPAYRSGKTSRPTAVAPSGGEGVQPRPKSYFIVDWYSSRWLSRAVGEQRLLGASISWAIMG